MSDPVVRWMESGGLAVRREFVTPWGICDLAGISFNRENAARRICLGQRRPLSSIIRAMLLLQIPDTESSGSVRVSTLIRNAQPYVPEKMVREEIGRLVAGKYVMIAQGRLKKHNGWMPLHERFVSVELKLSRLDEATQQASSNLGFADESFVALPMPLAKRVATDPKRIRPFTETGIGLLAVTPLGCEVALPPRRMADRVERAVQLYCVDKFWRNYPKGS